MSNISLDSVPVVNLLEMFRKEMRDLDNLVEKMDTQTKNIKITWQGNASENTLGQIEKAKNAFDYIKTKNEKYVAFIDNVIVRYKALDENSNKFMEARSGAFDTSFYGDKQG